MQEIIEHYGLGLLETVGTLGILIIVFSFFGKNGILSESVLAYMQSICG